MASGRVILWVNDAVGVYSFLHENANSSAANRFWLSGGAQLDIQPYGMALTWYDVANSRVRALKL